MRTAHGVCWGHGATVGNITPTTDVLHGDFSAQAGSDAIVACELVAAGKYRNGAARAWCRTHQTYWGVNADLGELARTGLRRCAHHAQGMSYALKVPVIDVSEHAMVTIELSASDRIKVNVLEGTCAAVAIDVKETGIFDAPEITRVCLTPPAVRACLEARRIGQPLGCVSCARCRHPHLDLGDFAVKSHRRHYCGNCGNDSTHSAAAIISSPLHRLSEVFGARLAIV